MQEIKRGQIWYADLDGIKGSEQGGTRPVLIIQNDIGNKYSPTTIIAIITSRKTKATLPTHHWLNKRYGLTKDSMVELEQVRTIDKSRLTRLIGQVDKNEMTWLNEKLKISFAIS